MPLGLPPHLATRTTSTAVARAGHAGAAVCLVGIGVIVISVQAYLPQLIVWPALIVLLPMIVLLVLLERAPSPFIAASYLLIGGLCVFWYTLIVSRQLDTPVANDDYTIILFKLALILVIGVGSSLSASMLWTTGGFIVGEVASLCALLWLGSAWAVDPMTVIAWFVIVGLLGFMRLERLTHLDAQVELYRAARDEMLAEVRGVFEARATALLHDTVLNQLAVITATQRALSPAARDAITADLESIVGQQWFEVEPSTGAADAHRASRLRDAIDDAAAGDVNVTVSGSEHALDALDSEAFDEFTRAIAQCIANVRRHAGVGEADVVLGGSDHEVSAMVIDAGRGFALDAQTDGRLGVATSIVGRLETIGGTAVVWSQPGQGTSVLLRVPISDAAVRGDSS
ncbi:MAG: hypothetical protein KIT89_12035 [Microcella sp.]|uniref:sensor histidine kinase n=1 Tax=Microcella sp. TaxID=1913979 RepID=UPI0024C91F45|nr:hypothetical protein [Microcella sp.]UYN83406.1 MAG: hypothetical protein KIT89_12035 [Microcella sp.]